MKTKVKIFPASEKLEGEINAWLSQCEGNILAIVPLMTGESTSMFGSGGSVLESAVLVHYNEP